MGRPPGGYNAVTLENAGRIFDLLIENNRVGMTKREIVRELEINDQAFGTAFRCLRDLFQEEQEAPIIYEPRTHRYRFAGTKSEGRDYARWILKRLWTHTERHARFCRALEAKFPGDRRVRRIRRHQEALAEEIEDMLEEVGNHS